MLCAKLLEILLMLCALLKQLRVVISFHLVNLEQQAVVDVLELSVGNDEPPDLFTLGRNLSM